MVGYSDLNFAEYVDSRKFTSWYIFLLLKGYILEMQ